MKKVLFGLLALSCVSFAAETNVYLRAGGDIAGKFDVIKDDEGTDLSKKDAKDFGWEIAVEGTQEIIPNLELGLGLAYQDHGKPEMLTLNGKDDGIPVKLDLQMTGYTSVPLYVVGKYNFTSINNFTPYVKANLGYSINDAKDDAEVTATKENVSIPEKVDTKVKNGLYFGLGGGFEYNDFTVDLMYQINKAKAEFSGTDDEDGDWKETADFDYSRVTLSVGYKFNF